MTAKELFEAKEDGIGPPALQEFTVETSRQEKEEWEKANQDHCGLLSTGS